MHRSPAASQEDEEAEEGNSLSKHGRELQRLLKTTGLSESDDDPSNEVKSVLLQISCLPLCATRMSTCMESYITRHMYFSLALTQ